jgi:hypothetical protein
MGKVKTTFEEGLKLDELIVKHFDLTLLYFLQQTGLVLTKKP